jgi:hypothetical protein
MTPSRKAAWRRQRTAVERERRKLAWLPKRDRRRIEMEETAEMPKGWGVNPGHPAYAQWLMKLGFPMNDPIIELASIWATGTDASPKIIRLAMLSAERWMEARDKRLRSAGRSVMNKLQQYLAVAESREARRTFQYKPGSLTTRANPRRRRNPRTYHVRDQYLGEFHDYSRLKAAMRKARQLDQDILVEKDEILVPLSKAYPRAAALVAKANPLPNEHSARLISPSQVVKGTYRRRNVKGGSIGLLFAKVRGARKGPRGGSMKLASVHFRAAHFTPAQARKWMKEHGLRPILFEAARNRGKAAWRGEAARVKRGRRARGRRRAA